MRVLYLIGIPGSGKSTALRLATEEWKFVYESKVPFAHRVYEEGAILGRRDLVFPGTDTLSMSVNPKAIAFVAANDGLCVGEGDRLANRNFLSSCSELTLVHLDVPVGVARERARLRAEQNGREEQNESWWKGRVTKVDNLRAAFPHVSINGDRPQDAVADDLRTILRGSPATSTDG